MRALVLNCKVLQSEILVMASPTWLGQPSSVAKRVLERMDAMLSETDDQDRPVAYNRVAGVVVTGNEDGAHHVIAEVAHRFGRLARLICQSRDSFGGGLRQHQARRNDCVCRQFAQRLNRTLHLCSRVTIRSHRVEYDPH